MRRCLWPPARETCDPWAAGGAPPFRSGPGLATGPGRVLPNGEPCPMLLALCGVSRSIMVSYTESPGFILLARRASERAAPPSLARRANKREQSGRFGIRAREVTGQGRASWPCCSLFLAMLLPRREPLPGWGSRPRGRPAPCPAIYNTSLAPALVGNRGACLRYAFGATIPGRLLECLRVPRCWPTRRHRHAKTAAKRGL
jgi:hypothetical protein